MTVAARAPRRHLLPEWLRPPEATDDGTMALVDHLKEFRYRVTVAVVAIVIAMAACLIWFRPIYHLLMWPINQGVDSYIASHPEATSLKTIPNFSGIMLYLKVGLLGGLVVSCPVWLYQLWAFIAPGLLAKERKYALGFVGSAIPLFLAGIAVGYWVSPKGFAMLLQFNPPDTTNLLDVNSLLILEIRMLIVFGLSFLLPVILVALNLIGVVRGHQLARFRSLALFACFVFGAVATPSVDPFSMCALAVPMAVMYLVSEVICRAHDRRLIAEGKLVLPDADEDKD